MGVNEREKTRQGHGARKARRQAVRLAFAKLGVGEVLAYFASRRRRAAMETKPTSKSAAEVGSGTTGVLVFTLDPGDATLVPLFATKPESSKLILTIGWLGSFAGVAHNHKSLEIAS